MMSVWLLFGWMLFMGSAVFGGGQTFIPILEDMFVDTGLIEESYFYEIVGLANIFPGPFSGKVYTLFAFEHFNIWVAILVNIIFVVPAIITMMLASKAFKKLKNFKPFTNLTLYIKPIIVGILAYIGYDISKDYIFSELYLSFLGVGVVISNLVLFKLLGNKKVFVIIFNIAFALVIL